MHKGLKFIKMHGLGNDFIIIDTLKHAFSITYEMIPALANRHLGIGFDQLLVLKPTNPGSFYCQIFNADGSEAKQCGNGLRCVARYLHEEGYCHTNSFNIETLAGSFPVMIQDYQNIRIGMGTPFIQDKLKTLGQFKASVLSLGNTHGIIRVDSLNSISTAQCGAEIAKQLAIPEGINIGFMEVLDKHQVKLKTYERGSGETHACGSNACAAVIAGIVNHWLDTKVEVKLTYGSLFIEWQGPAQPIHMSGAAERIFTGVLY